MPGGGGCARRYDGDTITVAARLRRKGKPYLFRVRLARIDSPEMRGNDKAVRDSHRAHELVPRSIKALREYEATARAQLAAGAGPNAAGA